MKRKLKKIPTVVIQVERVEIFPCGRKLEDGWYVELNDKMENWYPIKKKAKR